MATRELDDKTFEFDDFDLVFDDEGECQLSAQQIQEQNEAMLAQNTDLSILLQNGDIPLYMQEKEDGPEDQNDQEMSG